MSAGAGWTHMPTCLQVVVAQYLELSDVAGRVCVWGGGARRTDATCVFPALPVSGAGRAQHGVPQQRFAARVCAGDTHCSPGAISMDVKFVSFGCVPNEFLSCEY